MHSIEQRLNRWILTLADRLHVEALHVTRNHTSHMVGVRRASITSAVATLRDEGLIETERGMMHHSRPPEDGRESLRVLRDH